MKGVKSVKMLELISSCSCRAAASASGLLSPPSWASWLGPAAVSRLRISWAVCDAEHCLCTTPGSVSCSRWGCWPPLHPLAFGASLRGTWNPHKSSWSAAEHKANPGNVGIVMWRSTWCLVPWLRADRCCLLLQNDLLGVTLQTLGGDNKHHLCLLLEFSILLTAAWF